ncbi:ATP-dependent RNA helicase eIF4A [Dictyocoela muelleri]|nr:ATP-dependent RNA helicase eIF4A [Dictyocoela muelleri]
MLEENDLNNEFSDNKNQNTNNEYHNEGEHNDGEEVTTLCLDVDYEPEDDIFEEAEEEVAFIETFERWEDYNLKEPLMRGIYSMGFETPSYIQKTAIKPIIDGKDLRAQAQSGMGKTGAFGIGSLQRIDENMPYPQVLIIGSTRELAIQNAEAIEKLAHFMQIKVPAFVGGVNLRDARIILENNPPIVVGTPGKILALINTEILKTDKMFMFVIDEADEMLKRGFKDQVKEIFLALPRDTIQVVMFSATYEEEEIEVANELLINPVHIDLRRDEQTLQGIEQYYVNLGARPARYGDLRKIDALVDLFKRENFGQSVIFVNTKQKAKYVYEILTNNQYQFSCDVIHGDMTHDERNAVLVRVREGKSRNLISTSIMARGIDVQQISTVINFDIVREDDMSTYIHRIGRAGRFGRRGRAINFIFNDEMPVIQKIMEHYQTKIDPLPDIK